MFNDNDPAWLEYQRFGRDAHATLVARRTALKGFMKVWKSEYGEDITISQLTEYAKNGNKDLEGAWMIYCKKTIENHAPKTVNAYSGLVRSFLGWWGFNFSKRARLPLDISSAQEQIHNKKFEYRPPDIGKLLEVVTDLRDRALILMFFQGGADLSTVLSLKYGDVALQLEREEVPLLITAQRKKTRVNYRFCVGRDTVNALNNYLSDRRMMRFACSKCHASWMMSRKTCPYCSGGVNAEPVDIGYEEPLFVPHNGKKKSLSTPAFTQRMKRYVKMSKIVDPRRMERADFNIAGAHALRSAFSSVLQYRGMNQTIIDGLQGHKVPYGSAYSRMTDRELKELYAKYEEHLTVTNAEEMMTLREEMLEMKQKILDMEARELNRATNLAGAPEDPLKVELYRRLLKIVESDSALLQDFGR
jgi:integrase